MREIAMLLSLLGLAGGLSCAGDPTRPRDDGPGDATTTTLLPDGGSVRLRTSGGVDVELTFPPGAVRVPTQITVRPLTPAAGTFFSVALEPAGLVFYQAFEIRVTVPAGVDLADGILMLRPGEPVYLGTAVDPGAGTLIASLRFFGFTDTGTWSVPSVKQGGGNNLGGGHATCATVAAAAQQAFDAYVALGEFQQALIAALQAGAALQTAACPEAQAFIQLAAQASCDGLDAALQEAVATNINRLGQFIAVVRPILEWVSLAQRYAPSCPHINTYLNQIDQEITEFVLFFEGRLGTLTNEDFATFQDLKDDAVSAFELMGMAQMLGRSDAEDRIDRFAFRPAVDRMRHVAYRLCKDDQWHYPLSRLTGTGFFAARDIVGVTPPRPGSVHPAPSVYANFSDDDIFADLQFCATCIDLEALVTSGGALDSALTGGQGAPGQRIDTATLTVPTRGTLRLGGEIWGFTCWNDIRADDELVISLAGRDVLTLRRPVGGDNYLAAGPEELDIEIAARAAGITPSEGSTHRLQVRRERSNCDRRLWGDTPYTLLDATLAWRNPTLAVSMTFPSVVLPGEETPLDVQVALTDPLGQPGSAANIDVALAVQGGAAAQTRGSTDANGVFRTTVTAGAAARTLATAGFVGFVTIDATATSFEGATARDSHTATVLGPRAVLVESFHNVGGNVTVSSREPPCYQYDDYYDESTTTPYSGSLAIDLSCPTVSAGTHGFLSAGGQIPGGVISSLTASGQVDGTSSGGGDGASGHGQGSVGAGWRFQVQDGTIAYRLTGSITTASDGGVPVILLCTTDERRPCYNVIQSFGTSGQVDVQGTLGPGMYLLTCTSHASSVHSQAPESANLTFTIGAN